MTLVLLYNGTNHICEDPFLTEVSLLAPYILTPSLEELGFQHRLLAYNPGSIRSCHVGLEDKDACKVVTLGWREK